MHIVRRLAADKFFIGTAILFLALLTSFLTGKLAFAADPSITRETCYSNDSNFMTNRKSPFSQTSGMCLGDGDGGRRFYQFGVQIVTPSPISNVHVTAKAGNTSISFRKVHDALYVSDTSHANGMGYMANTGTGASCNRNDPANKVRIEATGNGRLDVIDINLCDKASADQTLAYEKSTNLRSDSGQANDLGWITGKIGIIRDGAPSDHPSRLGALQQVGITSIKLSGPETFEGNSTSDWYQITANGELRIKRGAEGIKPGIYSLNIVYNDKIAITRANPPGDVAWTTDNLRLNFTNIRVEANKGVSITKGDAVAYYDKDGKLVDNPETTDADKTSCAIIGIGWIICPVVNFLAKVVDGSYVIVASLLTTPPLNTDIRDANNGAYQSWSVMRNIANVAFVIAFMIIIYSQLSGLGVTNYGIKKLLPKLIVAAILVNVSYWICAIAVDLSNILGSSAKALLDNITKGIGTDTTASDWTTGQNPFSRIASTLLVTTVALYVGLSAFLPILITALVAIVTVLVVLILRQALIVLLIVISPLAFVALLLPNTESLFQKWKSLLMTLLLMFPAIALIFGAATLASKIITISVPVTGENANAMQSMLVQIMAAGIAIIPLFITPVVMKTAGGVLNRFAGYVNNPNKGPFDRLRKGADGIRERQEGRRSIRAMNGGAVFGGGRFRRHARREAISQGIKGEANRATNQFIAEEIEGNKAFRNQVAGGSRGLYTPDATEDAMQRALSNAKLTIDKAVAEDIQAESVIVRNFDASQLKGVLADTNASEAKKAAAMQRLIKVSDPGGADGYANEVNTAIASSSEILRRATAESLAKDGPGFIKGSDVDKIATGVAASSGSTLQSIAAKNVADGVYSQEKMVDETHGNLQFAFDNAVKVDVTTGAIDRTGQQNMVNTASQLNANPNLNGKIKHNRTAIDDLRTGARPR